MTRNQLTVPVVLALVFLAGCASQAKLEADRDAIFPEIDVPAINGKINEALQGVQDNKVRLDTLEATAAEIDEKIMALSEEMMGTSPARIEELETRIILLTETIKDLQAQVATLRQESASAREQLATISSVKSSKQGAVQQAAKPAPVPTAAAAAPSPVAAEYAAYQIGLRFYGGRLYKQAVKAFGDQLQQFPQGRFACDASYWTGESLFRLSDYSSAIGAFNKVAAVHASPKADDALFRIGQAYVKIGQKDTAAITFKRLVEEFPESEFVPQAQKYLSHAK